MRNWTKGWISSKIQESMLTMDLTKQNNHTALFTSSMIYAWHDMMFFHFVYLCKAVLVILFRHRYLHTLGYVRLASSCSLWIREAVKYIERIPLNVSIYACHLEISNSGISTSWKTLRYCEIKLFKELKKIHFNACVNDQMPQEC